MTRHKGLRSIAAAVQASTNEAVCENSQIGGIGAGLPTPLFEDRFRQAHLGQHARARPPLLRNTFRRSPSQIRALHV